MQELIIKMVFCLLVALALGFIFGWLIKRAFSKEKYGPIIEDLETNLALNKNALIKSEEESQLIKEQFITSKDELDISTLKVTELEEHLSHYQTKVTKLEDDAKGKESHIQEILQASNLLHTELDGSKKELDQITKQLHSQQEEMGRIKEHHTLLQAQVNKLTQEKEMKEKELGKLSIMIDDYKSNEQKLLDETKAQAGKLTELKSTLNEKNIASLELGNKVKEIDKLHIMITDYKANEQRLLDEKKAQESKLAELHNKLTTKDSTPQEIDDLHIMINNYKTNEQKLLDEAKAKEGKLTELETTLNEKNIASLELSTKIKEIDALNQKNSELSERLEKEKEATQTYKSSLKELEKRVNKNIPNSENKEVFDKLEPSVEKSTSIQASQEEQSSEGFNFIKFAKKTLDKITMAGDDINTQADKVIQEYKDRK